jgi:hypothetical protein
MIFLNHRGELSIGRLATLLFAAMLLTSAFAYGQVAESSVQSAAAPADPGPSATNSGVQDPSPPLPSAAAPTSTSAQKGDTHPAATQDQPTLQKPVGSAAAPPERAAGVTASRPAGAVIAPAKQRRARAILIRVGLLVGAGVALGTVLALTHATPSQPQ